MECLQTFHTYSTAKWQRYSEKACSGAVGRLNGKSTANEGCTTQTLPIIALPSQYYMTIETHTQTYIYIQYTYTYLVIYTIYISLYGSGVVSGVLKTEAF